MKRIIPLVGVFVSILLVVASPASATFYGGGAVGQGSSDLGLSDMSDGSQLTGNVDDSATGWRLYGGYKVFRFFAVEAAWMDVGEVSVDATSDGSGLIYVPGSVTSELSADGYALAGLGVLPIGSKYQLFAKMGYFFWDAEMSIANGGSTLAGGTDGEDMLYGAGFVWNYTGPGSLRLEYETIDMDAMGVDTLSAGLSFRF